MSGSPIDVPQLLTRVEKPSTEDTRLITKDFLEGDVSLYERHLKNIDTKAIQKAIDYIYNNPNLSDAQKAKILSRSWSVVYRRRPPTIEEFLTPTYLGRAAMEGNIYPRVERTILEFMDPHKPYRNLLLAPFIGWGKELENAARVMTPKGYTCIGDIQKGAEVCAPDGSITKVTGVFPQGKKPLYRVTFSDGRSVVAGLDHQWKAAKSKANGKAGSLAKGTPHWKTITTQELIQDLKKNPKARWYVPLTEAVQHEERSHIIPPYTMGALLGDGHFGNTNTKLYGDDKEIIEKVKKECEGTQVSFKEYTNEYCDYVLSFRSPEDAPKGTKGTNTYREEIRRLGLGESRSHTKYIPEQYLYDSIPNRIALLQGLMDTDGTAVKRSGQAHFYTTSPQLRDDLMLLVRGLGGRCTYATDNRKREHTIETKEGYVVFILFPKNSFPIFSLKRKQNIIDHHFDRPRKKSKTQHLYIQSIEYEKEGEATCIQVDHPEHLFLTDNYIVTHNSFASVIITMYIATLLSFMRDPKKYFNLNPAAVLCQGLISYSLKKSSELLLEPFFNILEVSDFFEKVHTKEGMVKKDREFDEMGEHVDRIFWTTAVPTSALQFSNGANIKLISSVQNLLGLTIVTAVLTELSFFREAGKALTLDTKIPTPSGYKRMGDLKIGDEVYTPKGTTTKIVDVLPQGTTPVYEIEFADGRTIKANPEHEWKVSKNRDHWKIMTTQELFEKHQTENPRYRWAVPFPQPIEWPERAHLIHPYLMGVLLGDGSFRQGQTLVSVGEDGDRAEMLNRIEEVLPSDYKYVYVESGRYIRIVQKTPARNEKGYLQPSSITQELERLGLLGKRSGAKFIPDEYLIDSPENRWELLRGLMDTDGHASLNKKSAVLTTSSFTLREGCVELVRQLGGYATCSSQLADWPSKKGQTRIYHINVTFPSNNHAIFYLERKQKRVDEAFAKNTRNNRGKLRIKDIRKVEDAETQCITIEDEDHLFIAGEGIVTKNSDEYILRFYNDTRARIESRMKGNYFGRTILDSSPNSFDNPIDKYVWGEARHDKTNLVVTGARWEWEPQEFEGDTSFPVYLGGPGKPPAILHSHEDYDPSDLLWVPERLRTFFENDLQKAIKDIGGRPSGNMHKLLYDSTLIENMFEPRLNNVYLYLHVPSTLPPKKAIWDMIHPDFFRLVGQQMRFYYRPEIPRVFAIDQSENKDVTSISIAHPERLQDDSILIVYDMTIVLHPEKSDINFDAIRHFIEDLVREGNMNIVEGTFDRYESGPARQYIERELGIPVRRISVDRTMDPYRNFISDVKAGRVKVGRNIFIKNNLKSLIITKRKKSESYKIDHTLGDMPDVHGDNEWETSLIGLHAKDVTDSMAAAAELIRGMEYPLYDHHDFQELQFIDAVLHDEDSYMEYIQQKTSMRRSH